MIKIGIEVSRRKLLYDLLENPGRYFFILSEGGRAALCIQTCDFQGDDINTHIINGFALNKDSKLCPIFDDGINDSILNGCKWERRTPDGRDYPISSKLEDTLCRLPDLMYWIISKVLTGGRNLVIYHPKINA
ncbi:hypothetical protein [Methanothrix soehngenii]|jgi:hypothetical protein|uniref:hypothetical protein n=1 Tax=Methanothrix soehngenii TaxID=2223 RepID=UPI0023F48B64|nr:hypothetical protein [Methanothrix soehngenii]MCK9586603.1 hypothetical protein [Methanothrix soehngenii]MDD5256889.1 hypothetical protein [Methanothrix soehngenii]MDD5736578.1 hypothetical protein [Methanothrix soehngenii]